MSLLQWGDSAQFKWFILIILIVGSYFYFEFKNKNKLNLAFGEKVNRWLSRNVSLVGRRWQLGVQVIGLAFLIVALARPLMGQSQQEVKSEGVELMIVADVSDSMLAEDLKPSRLEQMKIDLSRLVDLMPGNKTGLIAFAGSATLMSPLTTDPGALKMYIQSLDAHSVSEQGTSFESALSYATEAFEKGGVTQATDVKTTRVILIVSDGEDQEPGALEAAQKLVDKGIHIMSVAYGTEKGAPIPTRDRFGNLTGNKTDKSGQVVVTQVKGDFLKQLAQVDHSGGGSHFYISQYGGEHLQQIASDIGNFEKAEFASTLATQYDEKFSWPLTLGLFFILISLLISDRKSQQALQSEQWKGTYEV